MIFQFSAEVVASRGIIQDAVPRVRGGHQEVRGGRLRVPPGDRIVSPRQERELRHPRPAARSRRRALQDQRERKQAGLFLIVENLLCFEKPCETFYHETKPYYESKLTVLLMY